MRACKKIEKQLLFYAMDELSAHESAIVEAHIAVCPSCAAQVDAFKNLVQAMPQDKISEKTIIPARKALFARLQNRYTQQQPKPTWQPALQLAVLLICTLAAFMLGKSQSTHLQTNALLTATQNIEFPQGSVTPFLLSIGSVDEQAGVISITYNTINAIQLNGTLNDPLILAMLQQSILDHSNPVLQRHAMKALGSCHEFSPEKQQQLLTTLRQAIYSTQNYAVKQQCLKTIQCFDDEYTQPIFMRVMMSDTSEALKIQAFKALSRQENLQPDVLRALHFAQTDSSENAYIRSKSNKILDEFQL